MASHSNGYQIITTTEIIPSLKLTEGLGYEFMINTRRVTKEVDERIIRGV